jgi:hypothetical protein
MLIRLAWEIKAALKQLQIAASRKLSMITNGTSLVSISCQIPDLRERYESLGLNPHTGYFLEVGAFDGESFSNTSFLADQGWCDCTWSPFLLSVRELGGGIYLTLIAFPSIIPQSPKHQGFRICI